MLFLLANPSRMSGLGISGSFFNIVSGGGGMMDSFPSANILCRDCILKNLKIICCFIENTTQKSVKYLLFATT